MSTVLIERETTDASGLEYRAPAIITPTTMLDRALASGAGAETLSRLMDLQDRWLATQARMAFDAALSKAKGEIGPIAKNRRVAFKAKNGGTDTDYRHEDLAEIARTVDPVLAKHGLSYTYKTEQDLANGGRVSVTCRLRHAGGHIEETSLSASPDSSGNKNNIQMIASAVTYLQRYTLKAALGLAVSHDDDGQAAGGGGETITDAQADTIRQLITETGSNIDLFLRHFKIESIPDLPASDYERASSDLNRKKAKRP